MFIKHYWVHRQLKNKMKIAYIVPYVPNKIRTRPYNLINYLSRLGHEVSLFTLGSGEADFADAEHMKAICKQVYYCVQPTWRSLMNSVVALPSQKPLQTVYSWNPGFAKQIKTIIKSNDKTLSFDVIHVEHLRGSEYGVFLRSIFPDIPIVWDSVDSISHLFEQASKQSSSLFGKIITRLELGRTRKAEGDLVCHFDRVLVTSVTDKNAMIKLVPGGKKPSPISVLPNGVDLDYFIPNESVQRKPETIVFSGKMSYHANIAMVKYLVVEIMPRVWNRRPETQLVIVGKDPSPDVKSMADDVRITVTGTVDDIRPYLWKSTLAVVPLRYGAGIQNKILEAMATNTPVVTTSRAISALQALSGMELLVADTPDDFSSEILRLLEDKNFQVETARMGLQYIRKHHDWANVARQLLNDYQEAISHKVNSIQ